LAVNAFVAEFGLIYSQTINTVVYGCAGIAVIIVLSFHTGKGHISVLVLKSVVAISTIFGIYLSKIGLRHFEE